MHRDAHRGAPEQGGRATLPAAPLRGVLFGVLFGVPFGLFLGALLGCAPTPVRPPADDGGALVLAEVGARVITAEELESRVLERFYGPRALLGLVREALFLQGAAALGVGVDEGDLEARVEQELTAVLGETPAARRDSVERLRFQGLSVEDLERELRQEWRSALLIQAVVTAGRRVSEGDLRARYAETWSEPRRLVRHIAFPLRGDPEDPASMEAARQRAEAVREAILSGASFEESARSFSANPETAARGGEIGWLSAQDLGDGELAEFIAALPVGRLSPLFQEGTYGFQLFEVLDERPRRPFEEVRDELLRELREAPPTDAEILETEARLRREIPVRVRQDLPLPPRSGRVLPAASGE
ncbi:MAG: peptidylprolyl isomerase [Planctomycetota bacterium]|jgi:hypothetical protein